MKSNRRKRVLKGVAYCVVGLPVAYFILGPFPGMGCGFPILNALSGHPERRHGTHPSEFVGLWVSESPELYSFQKNAFYLSPKGQHLNLPGLTERVWHFDDGRLFLDSWSRCGNCYSGTRWVDYEVEFDGKERMKLTRLNPVGRITVDGWYRKMEITDEFVAALKGQRELSDEMQEFDAQLVLTIIESRDDWASSGEGL